MRLIPAVILCALLGIVYWVGATLFTDRIQTDITERSSAAISDLQPNVDLSVDGRDVTLTGLVNTENQRDQAKQKVDAVWGVRASQNLLEVRDPYSFHGTHTTPGVMTMSGNVDSPGAIDYMKRSITPIVPQGSVATTGRTMPNSGQKLALGAGALMLLRNGDLKIDEEQFSLTGDAEDIDAKNRILTKLDRNQSVIDPLQLITDISVVNNMTQACRNALDSVIDQDTVLFEVDRSEVTTRYQDTVAAYAQLLQICPGIVLVEAHADHDGSENYNETLSMQRADAVAQLLWDSGVQTERVQTFYYGETRPIASNETVHDKSYNRRVDLEYVHPLVPKHTSIQQPIISSQSAE